MFCSGNDAGCNSILPEVIVVLVVLIVMRIVLIVLAVGVIVVLILLHVLQIMHICNSGLRIVFFYPLPVANCIYLLNRKTGPRTQIGAIVSFLYEM